MPNVNTTSKNPTHFLAAVELIHEAHPALEIPNENWPGPTQIRLGTPRTDAYYAEVWNDGMDYQRTYWAIESVLYENPVALPLLVFQDHESRDNFNDYDFNELLMGMLWHRRATTWFEKQNMPYDSGVYNDTVWPFLNTVPNAHPPSIGGCAGLEPYSFQHASQCQVFFFANPLFIRPKGVSRYSLSIGDSNKASVESKPLDQRPKPEPGQTIDEGKYPTETIRPTFTIKK